MNEVYTVDELARDCDYQEHVSKIVDQINLGDVVTYKGKECGRYGSELVYQNERLCLNTAFDELGEDNAREMLSKLDGQNPVPAKFLTMLDEKIQELAEEAARSYKGKYL